MRAPLALALAAWVAVAVGSDGVFRGVNLGGWLVLESWIVPSLFSDNNVPDGSGEWEFCEALGPNKSATVIKQHWQSWVQQSDIQALAAANVTHLRIPVGYWIVDIQPGEPFVAGGWSALVQVLEWIHSANMYAIIDLHGAPGSQNGEDHSGRSSNGIHWQEPDNVARTVSVLTTIAKNALSVNMQPETQDVIVGIEALNEPKTTYLSGPITMDLLFSFYTQAYNAIRGTGFTGDVWLHDGWGYNDPGWQGFLAPPQAYSVYIDSHIYHAFGGDRQQPTPWTNIAYTCRNDLPMIQNHFATDWTIVGEWSLATGPGTPQDANGISWLSSFFDAQLQAYCGQCYNSSAPATPGKGAFFWNFKIEQGYLEWNFLAGVQQGFIGTQYSGQPSSYALDCASFN